MSHPFFVITTQNQVGKHISKDAGSGGARLVIAAKAIGLRGLFHGAIVSQIFQTPNSVVYLWSLEQSRESTRAFLSAYYPSLSTGTVDAIQVTCSAGVSNFLSMIISYPANLVITKMVIQEKNNRLGFINTIKEIYKTHGKHGFSHGFAGMISRIVIYRDFMLI